MVNDDSPMVFVYGYPIFGQSHMAFRTTSTATALDSAGFQLDSPEPHVQCPQAQRG